MAGLEGSFFWNGEEVAIGEGLRSRVAIGFGLRAIAWFGMALLLFRGPTFILAGADRGGTPFDLTAPISRTRFLFGRILGVLSVFAAIWVAALFLQQLFSPSLLSSGGVGLFRVIGGAILLLLGQVLLLALLLLLRLWLGAWGAFAALLAWAASWFLSLDLLEAYLFDVRAPAESMGAWWYPLLEPYLAGEPAGFMASVLRGFVRLFPPIANVQSVGIDWALGREVFPDADRLAVPGAVIWSALFLGFADRIFKRKDL